MVSIEFNEWQLTGHPGQSGTQNARSNPQENAGGPHGRTRTYGSVRAKGAQSEIRQLKAEGRGYAGTVGV